MRTHVTVGRGARFAEIVGRYRAAAGGAIVAFALAWGSALGFGAVAERLTINVAAARGSAAGLSEARPIHSTLRVADRWYDEPNSATNTLRTHVVDRWYDATAVATIRTTRVADR